MNDFNEKLSTWVAAVQGIINKDRRFPIEVVVETGKKYARIVETREVVVDGKKQIAERSAYAFIDLSNGDVLKPDGWKRPAKHARGNILDGTGLKMAGPYGMENLR